MHRTEQHRLRRVSNKSRPIAACGINDEMLLDSGGFIVLYSVSVLVHGMGMGMAPQPCAYYHAVVLHVPVLAHTKYEY